MHANSIKLAKKNDFVGEYPKLKRDITSMFAKCDIVMSSKPRNKQNELLAKIYLETGIFSEVDCY